LEVEGKTLISSIIMKLFVVLAVFGAIAASAFAQECNQPQGLRVDCHPEADASEASCLQRNCHWCPIDNPTYANTPWCYLPENYGYKMNGLAVETPIGWRVNLTRSSQDSTYFGEDFNEVTIDVEFWEDHHLRVKAYPTNTVRYEVPLPLKVSPPNSAAANPEYEVTFTDSPAFSFKVIRKSSGAVLFDTSTGGLTFSNQFIQFSTKLPSTRLYGIGENEQYTYKHAFDGYYTYALWARDQVPDAKTNMYGVHPYYTVVEDDGKAHSVVIVNSNAQEFQITPTPGYVYRTIGGILDIHFFLGPSVENTVQQYTEVIGRAPIPPYWGLGFQLCRWGYNNLDNMKAAVDRMAQYNIPHDVQYGDIDIMDRSLDFTVDPVNFAGLQEYVLELKTKGIKFVTILDPGIHVDEPAGEYRPLDLGNEMDVWLRRPDGTPMVGQVWPGQTYFPDYSKPAAREWWVTLVKEFQDLLSYDGLWIDMNEPASWGMGDILQGCANDTINKPPYVPGIRDRNLAAQTICPDVRHEFGLHYDTHSMYGWSESEPTLAGVRAALNKRGVVLSRSTFLGSGNWASHWLGDNFSRWSNLHHSIIGMLQFNLFGIPYVGADICGFNEEATEEMCQRWQQLGAFYTFSRNHNVLGAKDQDPGVWGPALAESTRKALLVRYTLIPYLYTLFFRHATTGSTVARGLWHEFSTDENALSVDRQFLWGSGLLVTPVLEEGQTTVTGYFPDAKWYDYYTGSLVPVRGDFLELPAPMDFINLHVRGGIVYPTQEPEVTTELARKNPFGLIVALDDAEEATGSLYIDDGDSIDPQVSKAYTELGFTVKSNVLTGTTVFNGFPVDDKVLGSIRLLGVSSGVVSTVLVNGEEHSEFTVLPSGEVSITGLSVAIGSDFSVSWTVSN